LPESLLLRTPTNSHDYLSYDELQGTSDQVSYLYKRGEFTIKALLWQILAPAKSTYSPSLVIKACPINKNMGLVKSGNTECELTCSPRKAQLEDGVNKYRRWKTLDD